MIESSTIFRKSSDQVSCRINNEIAILNLKRELYFGVQGAGVPIWEALEQPRSIAELCSVVSAAFDISPVECRADVVDFLEKLQGEGLVDADA